MVDAERLHRILRGITDRIHRLQAYAGQEHADLLDDEVRLGHLKYLFITVIEGCIDAAQHVCASEGFGPPDTNADAVRVLGNHDVVAGELANRVARAVAFRNLLVHGYAEIDDRQVVANLDHLADLREYVDTLARLIADEDS